MASGSAAVLRSDGDSREKPQHLWRVLDGTPRSAEHSRSQTVAPHWRTDAPQAESGGVRGWIVSSEQDFYDLETDWRELSSQTARNSLFRSWDFAVEWFESFVVGRVGGATGRFQIVVAVNGDGRVIGLLPLYEERLPTGNGNLGTTMQPFGRGTSFDPMTDEPIVLLRSGHEEAATRYFRSMVPPASGWSTWDIAVMDEFEGDRSQAFTPALLAGRGKSLEITRYRPGLMRLKLPGTWQQFKAGLSKTMRDNVNYYPRRLTREVGEWTIRTARSPADVAKATEALITLHRLRGESRVGPRHVNHIPLEANASFIRHWFRRLSWRQSVAIMTVEIKGEIVAAQAFLETQGSLFVYYSGFHERWYRCSPLTIIMSAAIEDAIGRNLARIDFPPVSTPYKTRWGAVEESPIVQTFLYSLRLAALLRGAARRFSRARVQREPAER